MLFEERNWTLLPSSPNPAILLLDCVFESLAILESSNCVFEVKILEGFLTNSDSRSDEIQVDPIGINTALQLCHFLPLDLSLVNRVKELK